MRNLLIAIMVLLASAAHAGKTYTLENKDGRYFSTGAITIGKQDKETFGAAVLWALEQAGATEKAKSAIESYDPKELKLSLKPSVPSGDYNYTFLLTMQAKDGKLLYLIEGIRCMPKGVLGAFSTVNFDKVNLVKKPQHKEFIDRFDALLDEYVTLIGTTVKSKNMDLTHWEAIVKGQIVKGMTESECLMAAGKPANIVENTQRTQWTYESGMIVVFEDGKVTAVVK